MFTTLGCLATTMTVCTALLSWMEPRDADRPPTSDRAPGPEQAAQAVAGGNGMSAHAWRSIEIAPVTEDDPARGEILAARIPPPHHFLVSSGGYVQATPTWRWQDPGVDPPGVIRVGISNQDENQDISLAQWLGLRELIIALNNRLVPTSPSLIVEVATSLETTSSRLARRLRELLAAEGWLAPQG